MDLVKLAKDVVFNENCELKERLQAIKILIDATGSEIKKKEYGLKRLIAFEKTLVEKLIEKYKQEKIIEFMKNFDGNLTPENIKKIQRLDKPPHCYRVSNGIVIEEDCDICGRRCHDEHQ